MIQLGSNIILSSNQIIQTVLVCGEVESGISTRHEIALGPLRHSSGLVTDDHGTDFTVSGEAVVDEVGDGGVMLDGQDTSGLKVGAQGGVHGGDV